MLKKSADLIGSIFSHFAFGFIDDSKFTELNLKWTVLPKKSDVETSPY